MESSHNRPKLVKSGPLYSVLLALLLPQRRGARLTATNSLPNCPDFCRSEGGLAFSSVKSLSKTMDGVSWPPLR